MKIDASTMVASAIADMRNAALKAAEQKTESVTAAAASTRDENAPPTFHERRENDTKLEAMQGSTAIDRIREVGLSAYAEELHKEKLAEMRREILAAMGLTEDMLKEMSSDQRSTIEDMVAAEMRKRLAAMSEMENSESEKNPRDKEMAVAMINRPKGTGPGLGVLIALQEVEAASEGPEAQNGPKDKPESEPHNPEAG